MRGKHSALDNDVLLLNEIGLDPGIDHCSAIDMIERFRAEGKKVQSFISFCGGLPAPDVPITPLRYKFSWSPRGVLSAALNSAKYKLNGEVWNIPGDSLLKSYFPTVPISDELQLEGIANRDSLPYLETYSLGPRADIRTVLRGTLRYPGFSSLMQSFKSLGVLETEKKIYLKDWSSLLLQSLHSKYDAEPKSFDVRTAIFKLIPARQVNALFDAAEWLSLLPPKAAYRDQGTLPPLPDAPMAPIDLFSILLAHKLRYRKGERDMVVMAHEVITQAMTGAHEKEVHTASLVVYGTEKASAMARTVGLPVAIAALHVLDGGTPVRGVAGPSHSSVYTHILNELNAAGLGMVERTRPQHEGKTIEASLAVPGW
ncbi:hypothetical protein HGRIS_010692 [Hohenbuehelia grisea]|uniref:Saccharopine dehydrogenase-like C-terminal domain-containing protein n=1 Tax=Hohenbuehelia grisea TaxID=104357 RepID=A0ABR3IXR6_9AGAR